MNPEELLTQFAARLPEVIETAIEAQVATAIHESLQAAEIAKRDGALDIHQAMITRARRMLGLPNA